MRFQRKLIVIALASALPMASAFAQSAADLKAEIEALKAQLMKLQKRVEAMSEAPAVNPQQVSKLELRADQADDDAEKSGFKGLKINGTIEATYRMSSADNNHKFFASSGYTDADAGVGMLQITKESQGGQGVDWTLRLLPSSGAYQVHEASVSVPLNKETRLIAGKIPDWQGYEFNFPNANPTLGNQLITHNALYDLAGASFYEGFGMSHQLSSAVALKWLVGNIDGATDDGGNGTGAAQKRSVGLTFRTDWAVDEYRSIGFSGAIGGNSRNFQVYSLDGGYVRGDWAFNGHLIYGQMDNAAYSGDAQWAGLSGLMAYKLTPRLQLLARADYLDNRKNGGGTYAFNYQNNQNALDANGNPALLGTGTGPELNSDGTIALDGGGNAVGANLTRISLGTNYTLNANTQWKTEVRLDQSSGYNFVDADGKNTKTQTTIATSVVLSF